MEVYQKQGMVSIIGSIGLIILLAGIFLKGFDFTYALFLALSFWILAGVASSFLGVDHNGKIKINSGWRFGVVSLLGGIGVIILLAGIFLKISFNYALFIAIVFWISSGIVAKFLGIDKYRKHSQNMINNYQYYQQQTNISTPTNLYEKNFDGPAKKFCPACGTSLQHADTFCSNCGSSMVNV